MAINATSGPNIPYDIINVTGSTNILEFVQNVNNMVDGVFMLGMLLAAFVVLYVSMRSSGNQDALVATTFIITIISFSFYGLNFIDGLYVIILIILLGILFLFKVFSKE